MKQNNMLAMILAGGRGSRLHDLTNKVAKPAVSYGGKYRIIDFPLSNCANSGIDNVGVLTQYESILLNSYVAAGRRWGLDAQNSGVYVLPPREKADADLDVYRGTADAISQNIDFVDMFAPEYVLILSGDHIYKMNYDNMLDYHKETGADATIAVIEVPMKEASRFGIMNTDDEGRIVVSGEKKDNDIYISIEDNGMGMEQSVAESLVTYQAEGYGLKNVNDRICLLYGEEYKIRITSSVGKGTVVEMRIPKGETS